MRFSWSIQIIYKYVSGQFPPESDLLKKIFASLPLSPDSEILCLIQVMKSHKIIRA